ncbi:MAG: type IV pilus assembly protein PilM [Candidatus Nealsonbacteria bacterium]
MLELFKLKPETFGLDISDLSLKIIKLKKRKKELGLACFGERKIKPGIIKQGQIIKQDELTENILEAIKEVKGEKLGTRYVISSLPEEKAFFQVIKMPKISAGDLRSAIIYEAENYIPIPLEKVYLDFQVISPINNHLDHLDVLIAAIPKHTVDVYFSCLKSAGLEPQALEIESLAIARSLIKDGVTTSPVLLIDFGATKTSFIIFSGRSLRFTSSISVSSINFTEIISKSLGIDMAKAEKLKIKYGLEEKIKPKTKKEKSSIQKERSKIFEALVPALVDLTQQIKKHLHYYQTHSHGEHLSSDQKGKPKPLEEKSIPMGVSRILLCGGGSNLKGLGELLSLELKLPVEVGNPWVNILPGDKRGIPGLGLEKSLGYATVLGLALRGMLENNKDL